MADSPRGHSFVIAFLAFDFKFSASSQLSLSLLL